MGVTAGMAATPDDAYEPFRDCSGWFSQSVSEDTVKLWSKDVS